MPDKSPLLLVPGLLCDASLWRHQTRYLADISDVLVAKTTKDETLREMADRALSTAPERFALAGLSMGGYVALEIMRMAPGRVLRLDYWTRRLALMTTKCSNAGEALLNWRNRANSRGLRHV